MKRLITSSVSTDSEAERRLATIINHAFNCGYDMEVDDDYNIKLMPRGDDAKMAAVFKVTTVRSSDNVINFNTDMSFPDIKYAETDYPDTYHYYVKRWLAATEIADMLSRKEVDLNEEYED